MGYPTSFDGALNSEASWLRGGAIDGTAKPASFSAASLSRFLLYCVVLLFPFQIFAVPVATTKVDLSNIAFLVFLAELPFLLRARASTRFYIVFAIFVIAEVVLQLYMQLPLTRFLSSFVWISSLWLVFGYRRWIQYNLTIVYYCILLVVGVAMIASLFQALYLQLDRPPGIMSEPSPAGMIMLATVAGIVLSFGEVKNIAARILLLVFAVMLLYTAFLLKTTHFVSFALAIIILAAILRIIGIGTLLLSAPILVVIYLVISGDAHYLDRFDLNATRVTNISVLAWLQGFDQMLTSLAKFPLTGAGMGGTGYFYFFSTYAQQLQLYGLADLNRYDAYSGFFRLVIETGPVFSALMLGAIYFHLRRFAKVVRAGNVTISPQAKEVLFVTAFSLTIIIGTLMKEPTWSRSTVVISMLLLFSAPYAALPGRRVPAASDGRSTLSSAAPFPPMQSA